MEFSVLSNNLKMPMMGFGVFQVTDKDVCKQSVLNAIRTGYRLIDTAAVYGNEDAVGGNDSNLLIVFYVQIMPDDFVMQLHRF